MEKNQYIPYVFIIFFRKKTLTTDSTKYFSDRYAKQTLFISLIFFVLYGLSMHSNVPVFENGIQLLTVLLLLTVLHFSLLLMTSLKQTETGVFSLLFHCVVW